MVISGRKRRISDQGFPLTAFAACRRASSEGMYPKLMMRKGRSRKTATAMPHNTTGILAGPVGTLVFTPAKNLNGAIGLARGKCPGSAAANPPVPVYDRQFDIALREATSRARAQTRATTA